MELNEKWEENLTLNYIEAASDTWDPGKQRLIVEAVTLNFSFYNCNYAVTLDTEDVKKDFPIIIMEGDSTLFHSLENMLEDKYWDKLKEAFRRYVAHYDIINNSEVTNG